MEAKANVDKRLEVYITGKMYFYSCRNIFFHHDVDGESTEKNRGAVEGRRRTFGEETGDTCVTAV